MDILFVIGRIMYGGFFLILGLRILKSSMRTAARLRVKRIPYARFVAIASGMLLVLAGLGVLTGHYTNITLTLAVASLVFVSFTLNDYWNYTEPEEIRREMSNFMRNMALIGATLMLFSILQPWSYAL